MLALYCCLLDVDFNAIRYMERYYVSCSSIGIPISLGPVVRFGFGVFNCVFMNQFKKDDLDSEASVIPLYWAEG